MEEEIKEIVVKKEIKVNGVVSVLIRVDTKFKEWIEGIQRERLKKFIDTSKTSSRKITSMIPKHNSVKKWLRSDLVNFQFK